MIKDILNKWGIILPVVVISLIISTLSASISIGLMLIIYGEILLFGAVMSIVMPLILAPPLLYKGADLTLSLDKSREELVKVNEILEATLGQVKELCGLVPICASCKKIRDDDGYWNMIESYIEKHSKAKFSHSICPDCAKKLYPDFTPRSKAKEEAGT